MEYDLTTIDDDEVAYLRRKLGIVFRDFKLLTDRNVHDNLGVLCFVPTDMKDKMQIESRIDEVLRHQYEQQKDTRCRLNYQEANNSA